MRKMSVAMTNADDFEGALPALLETAKVATKASYGAVFFVDREAPVADK